MASGPDRGNTNSIASLSVSTNRFNPSLLVKLHYAASAATWVRCTLLLCLLSLCFFIFFTVEQPIRSGESQHFLGADSGTYYKLADLLQNGGGSELALLSFSGNLLGPIAMAIVLKTPFWIMVCNIVLFLLAIQFCAPVDGLSRTKLGLLLAFNATTLVSLVTLNKEIFALIATLLLCRYVYTYSHSKVLLLSILVIGLLARWEQPAITLLFLFLRRRGSFFRRHPSVSILLIVLGISIAYPLAFRSSKIDLSWATDQAQVGGAIIILNNIQASFGYVLVVIPKALLSLYNRWTNPWYFLTEYLQQDFTDFANQFVIHLHCLAMLVLSGVALASGRLKLSRPLPFFMAVYLAITSANVFIQPRYQYPVYVLLCFDLARRESLAGPQRFRVSSTGLIPGFVLKQKRLMADAG